MKKNRYTIIFIFLFLSFFTCKEDQWLEEEVLDFYNAEDSYQTFDQFNQCYYCTEENRRGVGLDKPQAGGGGMTFQGISFSSFGHSGFTGTYAWADPTTGIVFVFLSNRTFPTMENRKLIDHSIRPRMLKLVYDAILY